jgi:hypothetical protein
MRPDPICILRDEETKELIVFVLQSKIKSIMVWRKRIESLTRDIFYTVVVRFGEMQCADSCFTAMVPDSKVPPRHRNPKRPAEQSIGCRIERQCGCLEVGSSKGVCSSWHNWKPQ